MGDEIEAKYSSTQPSHGDHPDTEAKQCHQPAHQSVAHWQLEPRDKSGYQSHPCRASQYQYTWNDATVEYIESNKPQTDYDRYAASHGYSLI
jgi:hypothetical protein